MTSRQRIDTSREIRQWIGLGITAVSVWIYIDTTHPDITKSIKNKLKIGKKKEDNEN